MPFLRYARLVAQIGALSFAIPTAISVAQTPVARQPTAGDGPVLRIGVAIVRIDATVTDAGGRHVSDLGVGDFEVLQDGRPQQISTFEYVRASDRSADPGVDAAPRGSPAPLSPDRIRRTIAIVVDDLGLSIESTNRARKALAQFVDTAMRPGDLVAILRTGAGMGALQQFTSDRRMLHAAADRIRWNLRSRGSLFQTPLDDVDAFRNEILSAGTLGAITYVIHGVADLPGRKSVIVLSDGFRLKDADGTYGRVLDALRTLVDAASRAGVVVYGVDTRGLVATGPTAANRGPGTGTARSVELAETQDGLGALADATGGLFFRDANDIGRGVLRALEDQQGYYLLGYVPDESTFTSGAPRFHKLTVRVKRPGVRVRSRSGFLGVPDGDFKNRPATNRLVAAVTSPFAGADVRLRLSSFFTHEKIGSVVQSVLHVDARDLTFVEQPDGTRSAEVETLVVTFGENGQLADQASDRYTLRLARDAYVRALDRGLVFRAQVLLRRPGPYQVRIALRDLASERIGSASQFIDVPDISKGRLTLSGLFIQSVRQPAHSAAGGAYQEEDPKATVALRTFRQATSPTYGCEVYNARRGRDGQPQLESEIRLYRDGAEVFRTPAAPVASIATTEASLIATGVLQLGSFTPGSYVLEILVTDRLARKGPVARQTIDFEVVR